MPAPAAPRTSRAQPCPDPPGPAPARPRRDFLDLDAELTESRRARARTRQTLREWQLAGLTDDAETIVAELVANAVQHSDRLKQPAIRLALEFSEGELTIRVKDGNPNPPRAQQPGEGMESGRGLLIVVQLSARWGWYRLESVPGKVVWAVLRADFTGAPADLHDDGSQGAGQLDRP